MQTVNGDDKRSPLVRGVLTARRIQATKQMLMGDVETMIAALVDAGRRIPVLLPSDDGDEILRAVERVREVVTARSGGPVAALRPELIVGAFLAEDGTTSCIAALSAAAGWGDTVLGACRNLEQVLAGEVA